MIATKIDQLNHYLINNFWIKIVFINENDVSIENIFNKKILKSFSILELPEKTIEEIVK